MVKRGTISEGICCRRCMPVWMPLPAASESAYRGRARASCHSAGIFTHKGIGTEIVSQSVTNQRGVGAPQPERSALNGLWFRLVD